jgi:hypothetical protein
VPAASLPILEQARSLACPKNLLSVSPWLPLMGLEKLSIPFHLPHVYLFMPHFLPHGVGFRFYLFSLCEPSSLCVSRVLCLHCSFLNSYLILENLKL